MISGIISIAIGLVLIEHAGPILVVIGFVMAIGGGLRVLAWLFLLIVELFGG